MIHGLGLLAASSAFLFTGASLYISWVEHPARLSVDTRTAATQWAPSYKRATVMQASLAVVSAVSGVATALLTGDWFWLVAAALIALVVPFTLLVILPTNKQLLAPGRDLSSSDTRQLLVKWGELHWVRSVLSFMASAVYLWRMSGV